MGGKKKQTIGYKYFLGMHLVACLGPIDRITKIFSDKKLAWEGDVADGTISIVADELYGGEEKEGGISGAMDIQMGLPTQTVNSYLAAKLPTELLPAFRGVVSFFARQMYVGTQTYLKGLSFLGCRINVRQDGIEQWYLEKAEILNNPDASGTRVSVVAGGDSSAAFASPDGLNWPYSSNNPPGYPLKEILLSDDKLKFYAITSFSKFLETTDGFVWNQLYDFEPVAGGGLTNFVRFKGYWVVGRSIYGTSYSLDGVAWTHIGGPTSNLITDGDNYLFATSSSSSYLQVCTVPMGGWTNGVDLTNKIIRRGFAANGVIKICGGDSFSSGHYAAKIYTTVDGSSLVPDATPSGILDYFIDIAYGNNRWVAVGYTGEIIVLEDGGSWELRSDVLPYGSSEARTIRFFDGRFWIAFHNNGFPLLGQIITSVDASDGSWVVSSLNPGTSNAIRAFAGGALMGAGAPTGDMNPVHIIRECLTDPDWGLGYQDADIDDVSFMACADKLFTERFGMSLLWTRQTTIEDFIKEILKHIDASLFIDRKTGKFKLVLIRDDFDEEDLIVLNKSNIDHISDFVRPTFGELTNSITVQFWDKELLEDSSVTIQDIALSQMQGAIINTTQSYAGVTTKELAARLAQRDLKSVSTPIASCTIYANRDAAELDVGSPFKLTWPDFKCNELIMRVVSIAYGDGQRNRVRLTCTQDVYKLPNTAIIVPEVPAWTDPNTAPVPATLRKPFEVPYLEAVQRQGQTAVDAVILADPGAGYVGAAAGRPSSASINANLYTNAGGGFTYKASFDFCPTATLDNDIDYLDLTFNISNAESLELVDDGSWFQIDDEILVKVSLVGTLLTVKRGALDTVPAKHLADSVLYFWDEFSGIDDTEYVDGESVDLKITPKTGLGELALGSAPTDTVDVVGRMARPYPPADVKVNGEYYPDSSTGLIGISWVHRDRKLQTGDSLLGFLDATIGPEAGTTYTTKLLDASDDSYITGETTISGNTSVLSTAFTGAALIELESVKSALNSYQKYLIPVFIISDDSLLTESEEAILTESSESILSEIAEVPEAVYFTSIEAADIRDGNRQTVFFYWGAYGGTWAPTWPCSFKMTVRRRGLTEGAPDLWSFTATVTGTSIVNLTPSEVDQGLTVGGTGGDPDDAGLNEVASDAGIDLYTAERQAPEYDYPDDWCADFNDIDIGYLADRAIAFPVGIPVRLRSNLGAPYFGTGLGEIEFYASSFSSNPGSGNPADQRYYYDETTDFYCLLGENFEDEVITARSQVSQVRFDGDVVVGWTYRITLDSTDFDYIALIGDTNFDVANELITLIDADANYEAELRTDLDDAYIKITGEPAIAFTVFAQIIV